MSSLDSIHVRAPAKINLSFRVLGKRSDGFHEIETLMAPVSLFDELAVREEGSEILLECDDDTLPTGKENLVVKAAETFREQAGGSKGVRLTLRKKIPHGAGLGGGSSDAAAALLALNRLQGEPLTISELAQLAAKIGSDVAFFLHASAARCRGRGELVEPAPLSEPLPLLLLKPSFGVPTPWAYSRWATSKELSSFSYAAQNCGLQTLVNDLERPVFEKFVFLGELKGWLKEQPEVAGALLSGSGSTVFALLKDGEAGPALAGRARERLDPDLWACACQTL